MFLKRVKSLFSYSDADENPSLWLAQSSVDFDGAISVGRGATLPLYLLVPRPASKTLSVLAAFDTRPFVITLPIVHILPASRALAMNERIVADYYAALAQPLRPSAPHPRAIISPQPSDLTEKAMRTIAKSTRACVGFLSSSIVDEALVLQALEMLHPFASGGKQRLLHASQREYYQKLIDACYKQTLK